jgi:gliding motility-associated-like protein
MGKTIPISLLCLLSLVIHGQDTCNHTAFHPIDILIDPSFANAPAPCLSGFTPTSNWYLPTNEMLTGFLFACTDFTIPDSTFYNHSFLNPNICFFPAVPQPVPNGQGVVAISDFGYEGDAHVYYGHKSYISTCLLSPLQKDSLYRFDFYAGFGGITRHDPFPVHTQVLVPEYSVSPETFGLFGLDDCSGIATPAPLIGCPAVGGWVPLGSVQVISDTGVWRKVSITFRAPRNLSAIAVGPSCDSAYRTSQEEKTYLYNGQPVIANQFSYFITGLQFYQSTAPPPVVSLVSGDSCSSTIVLQVQPAIYYKGSAFQWYRNDTTLGGQDGSTITLNRSNYRTADYRCQVQNDSICLVSDAFPVDWLPLPSATVFGSADTSACTGDSVLLNAGGDPSFAYRWQDGSTLPYHFVTQPGTSTVTISNDCGAVRAQKTVRFGKCDLSVYVPNGFTPNDDGHNDVFHAHYFYLPARFDLEVFNRNGLEVFATTDPGKGWDGKYNGVPQPAGAYIWHLDYRDAKGTERILRGTVMLIR